MKRLPPLVLVVLLVACGSPETPTPVPTVTPEPTVTPAPTASSAPTLTAAPTASPAPTATEEPTAPPSPVPTASGATGTDGTPAAAAAPTGPPVQGGAKPLVVTFEDAHYECRKECTESRWSYRSFQTLMKVENVSPDLTLAGGQEPTDGWAPRRWIITDGNREWIEDYAFQWIMTVNGSPQEFYQRPDLPPGGKAEWTWLTDPVPYGAWVKAVEYVDPWGNLYRQEFPKPEPGQFNYVDCGDPKEGNC